MNAKEIETQQNKFEKWITTNGLFPDLIVKDYDGFYYSPVTKISWDIWVAVATQNSI